MKKDKLKPKLDIREIGRTGLKSFSGVIYEEELRQLSTTSLRQKIYKEMYENDAIVGAMSFAIDMIIRKVNWDVKAANDSPMAIKYADFLKTCLEDMSYSWTDTISEILSFLIWGWAWTEIVYKYRNGYSVKNSQSSLYNDGKIGWRKLALRGQDTLERWELDEEGGVRAMIQSPPPHYNRITIPIEKSLLFRTQIYKGNPEGRSILRSVYRSYYLKKKIENYEAIGVERDLPGFPVLYIPPEWTDSNAPTELRAAYDDAKTLVTNVKRDEQEGLVLPSIYDEQGNRLLEFSLINSGGKRNFDTDKIIQRYDQRIAMSVLADFILLGTKDVGSFALSSTKAGMFETATNSILKNIASTISRYAVPRLFAINGFDMSILPTLAPENVRTIGLVELGTYINKLASANIDFSDDKVLANKLRELADLPNIKQEQHSNQDYD